jgi:hypothetical protein
MMSFDAAVFVIDLAIAAAVLAVAMFAASLLRR